MSDEYLTDSEYRIKWTLEAVKELKNYILVVIGLLTYIAIRVS